MPGGLDIDEASILFWARRALSEGRFLAYAPEFTRWEMLPGYVHALAATSGILRLGPALFGALEIALAWGLARRRFGSEAGWCAAALLASSPWHFYYSRILGTCTGIVACYLMASLLAKKTRAHHAIGLLYYTTYRLVVLRDAALALARRNGKALAGIAGAVGAFCAIAWLGGAGPAEILTRGTYNLVTRPAIVAEHLGASAMMFFLPVPEAFRRTTETFMADYVHAGFHLAAPGLPALGWGGSALFGLALALLIIRLLIIRRWRGRPDERGIGAEAGFFVLGLLSLGFMGPSLSRMLILLPAVILISAWGLSRCAVPAPLRYATLAAIAAGGLSAQHAMYAALQAPAMEAVFHARHRRIAEFIRHRMPTAGKRTVFVVSDYGYRSARYWAGERPEYTLLPPVGGKELAWLMRLAADGREQYLVSDEVPETAEHLSGFNQTERAERTVSEALAHAIVLSERELTENGKVIARVRKVRWPSR